MKGSERRGEESEEEMRRSGMVEESGGGIEETGKRGLEVIGNCCVR